MQKIYKLSTLLLSLLLVSCNGGSTTAPTSEPTTSGPQLPEAETNINSSINYQIFVRTFADSNGDGIGDLNGIKNKIPYLKKIGVKSIWLTPIHKTSSDHGYDVQDYYSIAKDLGTMEDFEALVQELKANDMGIILDMVFNHASNVTSYFKQAYQDFDDEMSGIIKSDSKADWFNFSLDKKIGYIKYKDYYVGLLYDGRAHTTYNALARLSFAYLLLKNPHCLLWTNLKELLVVLKDHIVWFLLHDGLFLSFCTIGVLGLNILNGY